MKHISIMLLAFILLSSCGSSKTIRTSKRVMKGQWVLNSVDNTGTGIVGINLLNDVSKACMQQSTWNFVPNNNTGTYTINASGCSTGERYFVFTIDEVNEETGLYDFLLKPTNNRYKSDTNVGFRLNLKSLSDTYMQWEQTVISSSGTPVTITMNFTKI